MRKNIKFFPDLNRVRVVKMEHKIKSVMNKSFDEALGSSPLRKTAKHAYKSRNNIRVNKNDNRQPKFRKGIYE